MSRVSATFPAFIVAYMLRGRDHGVFGLITTAMVLVIVTIAIWGPVGARQTARRLTIIQDNFTRS